MRGRAGASPEWTLLQVCVYLDGLNAENNISLLVILCIIMYVKKNSKPIFFFTKPIMVKCLNIGKNIGKPIYRSISIIKVSAGWYNQQSVSQCFLRFCCFHSISQDYFPYLAWANILHQYLRAFIVSFTDEGRCRYWNVKTLTRSSEQVLFHFRWVCLLYICQI